MKLTRLGRRRKTWGVRCVRSGGSRLGFAESWLKHDGADLWFTEAEARKEALQLNVRCTSNHVRYTAERREPADA